MPGEDVTMALTRELSQANQQKRLLLLQTLGYRGDPAAVPAIVPLAQTGSATQRIAVIRSLVQLGDPSSIPVLVALVKDAEATVSSAAQTGLIGFPGREADAAVVALLNDSDVKTRVAAIEMADRRRIGNEQVFKLAVELQKVLSKDADIPLRPIVERFYGLSNRCLVDEYGELLTLEDAYEQLLDAWPKVSYPGILQEAKERARRHTRLRPELAHLDRKRGLLATVCYEIQQIAGENKDFYLSSYEAARVLWLDGKYHRKALRMLNRFCTEDILECTKRGNPKEGEANHYRYIGHLKQPQRPAEVQANIEDQLRRLKEE